MTASRAAAALVGHEPARLVERRDDGRAARLAGEDALLARDPPRHRERVAVRDPDPAVDDRRVVACPGKKSSPTPSVRYGRAVSPDRTLPSGSAPTIRIVGFCAREVVRDPR